MVSDITLDAAMSNFAVLDTRFRSALDRMAEQGRLQAYTAKADPHLEVAGIMKQLDGGPALMFTAVDGFDIPVVGNLLSCRENCEAAFGIDFRGIREFVGRALGAPQPPVMVERAPAQQHVHTNGIDLARMLPALHHTAADSGRYVTAGIVIVRDPETGVHNASYHRLQLCGGNRVAIKLDFGRHLRLAFERAQRKGEHLPVVICIGADLALHYTAATMGSQMPEHADELAVAGGLCGRALPIVKAVSQDLIVPADSEIVLEGRILIDETALEGPFGEFVGYLAPADQAPVVEITAVTHRDRPIYHAINGYGRETIMLRKYVLEASLLKVLQSAVPIVTDADMSAGGLHRFHAVVQVRKVDAAARRPAAQRHHGGVRRAQGPRSRHRGRRRHRHPRPARRRVCAGDPHGGLARPDPGPGGARARVRARRPERHPHQARHRCDGAVRRKGAFRALRVRARHDRGRKPVRATRKSCGITSTAGSPNAKE